MNSAGAANIESRAQFFKALGHPTRLLIMKLIKSKPRHGEELALILMLNPATVSHHLSILVKARLLHAEKDQYYQVYSLESKSLNKSLAEILFVPQAGLPESIEEDAYRQKVLSTFLRAATQATDSTLIGCIAKRMATNALSHNLPVILRKTRNSSQLLSICHITLTRRWLPALDP